MTALRWLTAPQADLAAQPWHAIAEATCAIEEAVEGWRAEPEARRCATCSSEACIRKRAPCVFGSDTPEVVVGSADQPDVAGH